jgi:hypothetical protein
MEKTISDAEMTRLPTFDEDELLAALLACSMAVYMGQPVLADVDRIVVSVDWARWTLRRNPMYPETSP